MPVCGPEPEDVGARDGVDVVIGQEQVENVSFGRPPRRAVLPDGIEACPGWQALLPGRRRFDFDQVLAYSFPNRRARIGIGKHGNRAAVRRNQRQRFTFSFP
jgi:hypothetical protein